MTFFDKKEEVMSVELTQYGKYLLSKGKFKPIYYNFIDDDILYDSKYGNFEELNSNVSNRIRNETPSLKPQYVFSGVETKIKQSVNDSRIAAENLFTDFIKNTVNSIQQTPEKQYFSASPLGNSDLFSKYYPSWKVNFLKGNIESVKQIKSGSSPNLFIPEITTRTAKYKLKTARVDQDVILQPDEYITKTFEDSSFIRVIGDSIIIELKEENTAVMNSNFDVEFYIQEIDSETSEEKLIPLYFDQKNSSIVNGILVGDGSQIINLDTTNDQKSAEYFFTINVDNEISDEIRQKLPESRQTELQIIPINNNSIKSSE